MRRFAMVPPAAVLFFVLLAPGPGVAAAARSIMPAEATALCKDGTYTKSQESQGACSQHEGVAFWLKAQ